MTALKDETYKGFVIKFYYDSPFIIAEVRGFGTWQKGRTKREAFDNIKYEIQFRQRRGNLPE